MMTTEYDVHVANKSPDVYSCVALAKCKSGSIENLYYCNRQHSQVKCSTPLSCMYEKTGK